jgi:predicted small lipoprotein YifL
MPVDARLPFRLAALAALVAVLAACGVKGPLEPPPSATRAETPADPDAAPARTMRGRSATPIERPDEPFILDSLL